MASDDAHARIQHLLVTGDNRLKQGVDPEKARESWLAALEAAREAGLPGPTLHAHEALVAAARGDRAGAARLLDQVPAEAIATDPTLAEVVRVTRRIVEGR